VKDEGNDHGKDPLDRRTSKDRSKKESIVVKTSATAQIPNAVSPPTTGPQHTAWSSLEHLYRISKVLAELTNVDQTVADVLAVMTNILPLRSAVLIHETEGHIQMVPWNAKGVSEGRMRTAKKHAMASYEYFSGVTTTLEADPAALDEAVLAPQLTADKKNFIAIPLVVGRSAIFGVLQLESPTAFNESDLIFLNAIANQLAVALDRHFAREREMFARAQAEEAERRMRFLAEAGRILASSLDHQATWESMAQLATCSTTADLCIADLCIIDLPERGPSAAQRTIVLSPDLRKWMTEKEVTEALAEVMSGVARTGQSAIYPEVWSKKIERLPANRDTKTIDVLPLKSYMCVPLELEGTIIGTLTVGWSGPGHIYSAPDLALLHDLVLRVVLAFVRARLYRSAIAAIRNRDDLVSIVSHDLRAPLAVILGFTNVFLRTVRPGEPVSCDPKHIEAIQRSATQMTRLIEDLLSMASIEAEQVLIDRQSNAVGPLIQEALELMQPLARRKDIRLTGEVPDDIQPIFADRERTMQVFANLIGNAIKFSPAGGAISVRAAQIEGCIQFSVEDAGPGIPEDQLARIFDRFWRAPGTEVMGTGLGLFIVKGIVDAHAGEVWATSKVGVGTTFFFTLPFFVQRPAESTPNVRFDR
jgi:signal transduction histidine kinase